MLIFEMNHPSGDKRRDKCRCELMKAKNQPLPKNWVNLDNLTELYWQNDQYVLMFGTTTYLVHGRGKIKALKEALWPKPEQPEPLDVRVVDPATQ